MLRKLIATSSTLITIPLRLVLATVMIAHGGQKVLGLWGGPGFQQFTSGNTPFSFMKPAWLWLGAAALSELVGGIFVGLGFLTRVGAFFIFCTMLTAVTIHWPNGFFSGNKGFEFPLALSAMALALLIAGGGQASIDKALTRGASTRGKK